MRLTTSSILFFIALNELFSSILVFFKIKIEIILGIWGVKRTLNKIER